MYTGGMKRESLADANPTYLREWAYDLNEITPEGISKSSGKKVWWRCDKGHVWNVSPNQRTTYQTGCAVCSNRKVLQGYNDLATTHPDTLPRWDYNKNTIKPEEVVAGSHKKVYWNWPCGHTTRVEIQQVVVAKYTCGVCAGRRGGHSGNNLLEAHPNLAAEWHEKNDRKPSEVTAVSGYRAFWRCLNGHEFYVRVCDRVNYGTGCSKCLGRAGTGAETDLVEYLETLEVAVERNDRKILGGLELDIVVPKSKVAIEFNGLYWHSDKFKDKMFHSRKTDAALGKGIQLIHVWEDEWRDKREIVKQMLASKLGVSNRKRLNARSLEVGGVTAREAREFLNTNHIQGFTNGSLYLALMDEGIQALMVMKATKTPGEYRLERYATASNVRGGFSRLFKNAVKTLNASRVITFADRGVSDGGLYSNNGFERDGVLAPDYKYLVRGRRVHKFNYRIKRFREDPTLQYRDGLTERELADLNSLPRVYDSGKVRWVWNSK